MKNYILKTMLLMAVVFSACSDEEVALTEETPMGTYTKSAGNLIKHYSGELQSLGFSFKTKKAGVITELGVSSAKADTLLVSLYDGVTFDSLTSKEVIITDAQIAANRYGFQYSVLSQGIPAKVNQQFIVAYTSYSGGITYVTQIIAPPSRKKSFIEFQSGVFSNIRNHISSCGDTYFTADFKIRYN